MDFSRRVLIGTISSLYRSKNRYSPDKGRCPQEVLAADLDCGPLMTSCGHAMHSTCFQTYFESLVDKERERQRK